MKKKETYNLILTCLSTIPPKTIIAIDEGKPNEYKYYKDNNLVTTGVMTNEAGIKYTIQELKDKGDKLDAIYYVASQRVMTKAVAFENGKEHSLNGLNHAKYFEKRIYEYCDECDFDPISFIKGDILSDSPTGQELVNFSAIIADKIISLKNSDENKDKEFHLYIEGNGGFRDFVNVATAVLSTLKNENIHIEKVIGVNLGANNTGVFMDKTNAYQIYDLYSGIDEFINYGRSRNIEYFFKEANLKLTDSMQKVIHSITRMSDFFTLCRPLLILKATKELKNSIERYNNSSEESKQKVFDYLTAKINRVYKPIFDTFDKTNEKESLVNYATVKAVIDYCLDHNLIQQSLIIYSELMPIVIYNMEILQPGKKVKQDYETYINNKNKNGSHYSKEYQFIQQDMLLLRKNKNNRGKKIDLVGLTPFEKYRIDNNNCFIKFPSTPNEKSSYVRKLLKGNYVASKYNIDNVILIIKDYWIIKEARNMSAHADISDKIPKDFYNLDSAKEYVRNAIGRIDELLGK